MVAINYFRNVVFCFVDLFHTTWKSGRAQAKCMMASEQTCQLVEEPYQDFTCLICHCVAEEPHQLTCECGKLYCKVCLDQHFTYFNYCPQCRKPVQKFPDARSTWVIATHIEHYSVVVGVGWGREVDQYSLGMVTNICVHCTKLHLYDLWSSSRFHRTYFGDLTTTTTRLLLNDYLSLDYELELDYPGS